MLPTKLYRLIWVAVLPLFSLIALNIWNTSNPAFAAGVIPISDQLQNEDAGGENAIIRDWLGNPSRFLFLFLEGEDFTVYVDRGDGSTTKVAHISKADADKCRANTEPNDLCETYLNDQGYETGLFSNGIGGLLIKVKPASVDAELTDNNPVPTPVPTSITTALTDSQFDARQEKNAGAAVEDSVTVVNKVGDPDPGLHIFREADGYAVYVGAQSRQGVKVAQFTALDVAKCLAQSDTTEPCQTYYNDRGFEIQLYPNGSGGLVSRVLPVQEGPVTVDTNIRVEHKANGLITIHGTGLGGAAFLLTPSKNPETIVIIAEDGTWQTDVAFVAGKHIIKLQDMDEKALPVGVAAQVEVTIEARPVDAEDIPTAEDTKVAVAIE